MIFGAFLLLVSSSFLYFEAFLIKPTMIPFALVEFEIGYSQLGPMGLVGYLLSHIQRAIME